MTDAEKLTELRQRLDRELPDTWRSIGEVLAGMGYTILVGSTPAYAGRPLVVLSVPPATYETSGITMASTVKF